MDNRPTPNAPIETFRDGRLKATVWRNESDKGDYYTVTLAKTHQDGRGKLRDINTFGPSEVLRVGELGREAQNFIVRLGRERKLERTSPEKANARDSDVPERFQR